METITDIDHTATIMDSVLGMSPEAIAERLCEECDDTIADNLERASPADAVEILQALSDERREQVMSAASPEWAAQWVVNETYGVDTLGRLMAPSLVEFPPDLSVGDAIERLRPIAARTLVSYAFVVAGDRRLLGVLVFRDMMLADRKKSVSEVMIADPFRLSASTPIVEGMREVLKWHYPVYPICDREGRLVGLIRGQTLFQQQAFELSSQAGSMVGVEKGERASTPWPRSLRFRHPWLQINLLTAFVAGAVVSVFQGTIDKTVALAVFIPVLAGQSGNTGSQTLAITLRGMTLGDMQGGRSRALIAKEAWLGLLNGAFVGLTAGLGMYLYANWSGTAAGTTLAAVVAISMTGACFLSGMSGVVIPLVMEKMGADPAASSTIFLTTITDCVSMGLFLGLATLMIP